MTLYILLNVIYASLLSAMAFAVALTRRQLKRSLANSAQLTEMLREAHAFIDFLGETQARVVADAIRRDIDDQRALLGEKRRSN